jgi:hypothetical protein
LIFFVRRKKAKINSDAPDEGSSIFDVINHPGSAIGARVIEWIGVYQDNSAKAINELVNFLLRASGSTSTASVEDTSNLDRKDVVDKAGEEMEEIQSLYPLLRHVDGNSSALYENMQISFLGKAKSKVSFQKRFREFWRQIVTETQNGLIYDTDFTNDVVDWLAVMAASKYKAFRHTCTDAAMHLVPEFVDSLSSFVSLFF